MSRANLQSEIVFVTNNQAKADRAEKTRSRRCGAEGVGAVSAGANAAEVIVAVNAGGVAVAEGDLNGVIADLRGGFRARLGLEHRESGGGDGTGTGKGALSYPLVIASGAGAFLAKISEIVVTGMTIGPGNVDAGAAAHVNFHGGRLFARIQRDGHRASGNRQALLLPLQQSPGGMGLPCGHVFGWPRKLQMRWSSSGLMMCSNLQAWLRASESSIAKVSLNKRSASRWRRTTSRARRLPPGVNCTSPFCNCTNCSSDMRPSTRAAGSSGRIGRRPAGPVA